MPSGQHELRSLQIWRRNEQPIEVCDGIDPRSVQKKLPIGHAPQKRGYIGAQGRFANASKVHPEGQLGAWRNAGGAGKDRGGDGEGGSVGVSVGASVSVSARVSACVLQGDAGVDGFQLRVFGLSCVARPSWIGGACRSRWR